ncbi:YadA family autotransporter adhesin [Caballeronia ptereochthonis]|nr:YadA-like family protein [Caballeronia ptereochthonis]
MTDSVNGGVLLSGIAAGVSARDAVNVSQLTPVVNALGGGASLNATTGAVTAPTYTLANANSIAGTTGAATSVGSGFSKVDAALGKLNTSVSGNTTAIDDLTNQINNGTIGLVQQAAAGQDLTVGKDTDGAAVNFADRNGATRTLKNVTAGNLSASSTDAVNGSQLFATNQQVTQNTTDINTINTKINNGSIGLVQQDASTRVITVAKSTDGTVVDMTGTQGTRTVTGVTAGQLSASSTDAVNGSQLYATNQNVAQNTADIANLNNNVAQNTTDIAKNTTNIAKNTTDINNINNAINSGNVGLVRQDANTRTITVAKDNDGTVVDMTGTQGARMVTGVAAGELSADSSDAVNGSQLYQTNQDVAGLMQQVKNFAGASTSVVASQKMDTPAVASGTDSTALGNGSIASGNNSVAIGSGSLANEDNTVSFGSQGNERRLTNVAPGINGTDAVNMNQLNTVQNSVNTVARQAFAGVAAAMAMPNLTPSQPGKTVVAAGVANYKGYTAVGVGGTYRSMNNHWLVNGAASFTPHGDTGVRGQVGYEF